MGQLWTVREPTTDAHCSMGAVVALLEGLRRHSPGQAALRFLHRQVPLEYLAVVEHTGDGSAPRLLEGLSVTQPQQDVTARCFSLYQANFHRLDHAASLAHHLVNVDPQTPQVEVLHYRLHDIPHPSWREKIFERERLAGRLSILFAGNAQNAYALNVYRDAGAGAFDGDELQRFVAVAPLLRAALLPQLEWLRPVATPQRIELAERRLADRADGLSPREREVAARIACGLSNDGIAADLGVAPATVVTLRKRAYAKLGLHSRLQLSWLLR
jgi:DNA-binding NarL/FixJ family response regulator